LHQRALSTDTPLRPRGCASALGWVTTFASGEGRRISSLPVFRAQSGFTSRLGDWSRVECATGGRDRAGLWLDCSTEWSRRWLRDPGTPDGPRGHLLPLRQTAGDWLSRSGDCCTFLLFVSDYMLQIVGDCRPQISASGGVGAISQAKAAKWPPGVARGTEASVL
jgi:hypothetical protein